MIVGSRVLCVHDGMVLLVRHHNPATDETYWLLPGGGVEPGESFEAAAVREVLEETGVDVTIATRLLVPSEETHRYAIFVATTNEAIDVSAHVDEGDALYLKGAAWCPVDDTNPLGWMNASHWSFIEPVIRWILEGNPAERSNEALGHLRY